MKASFQTTEKIPEDKDKLNKIVSGPLNTETSFFSTDGGPDDPRFDSAIETLF
jgi:hypothetical protein